MNWFDYLLGYYEREIAIILSILLIAFNLVNLYFIIELLGYDGMVVYRTDEGLKYSDPYRLMYELIIATMFNLIFVFVALYSRLTKDY